MGKQRTSRNVGGPRLTKEHRLGDVSIHLPVFTSKPLKKEHKETSLQLPASRRANVHTFQGQGCFVHHATFLYACVQKGIAGKTGTQKLNTRDKI